MDKTYTYKAYAKINIALDVLRKREDGYHDLKMIMQKISLHDTLTFQKTDTNTIDIFCETKISNLTDNLIYKAIKALSVTTNRDISVKVTLDKKIPMEAGLGGGSSDCATTLLAINEIFELNLPLKELEKIGATLGADVPYCLHNNTMIAEGIGDILTPIDNHPFCYLLVAKPDVNVGTASVFKNLRIDDIKTRPNFDMLIESFRTDNLELLSENLCNTLETVTISLYPLIDTLKIFMTDHKAISSLMSGSGSTVFGIFKTFEDVTYCKEMLEASEIPLQCLEICTPIN